ncbi:MAG: folate-binding protein YgfZ [Gammaproteobacteria bacterium]|nr:folate-binding protein YgfZ [Gammaproteobacteria bacterium]
MSVPPDNLILSLSNDWSVISLSGAGVETFLQGQLASDLLILTEEKGSLSVLCTAKGRVVSTFLLFKAGGIFYLHLPKSMVSSVLKALGKYSIFSKVICKDESDELAILGVGGTIVKEVFAPSFKLPETSFEQSVSDLLRVIRLPGTLSRFQVVAPFSVIHLFLEKAKAFPLTPYQIWKRYDILEKLPWIYPATSELFLPQMLNLQTWGAVSFTKGCYLGQEIIGRVEARGEVKRRLVLRQMQGSLPVPGAPVLTGSQEIGTIVDAYEGEEGKVCFLAVVHDRFLEHPLRI